MNCHSFCMGDPGQMMFHMRAANGGTYIVQDKKISKLNTKTKETISNMTYPFWHPSGRYITTSVNDIKQFFHSVKEKKMEVFDLESDVVVYDVKNKEILSKASLLTKDAFETFPAFSPDCKWLYFCTAPAQKMPENYDKVRYNLCRVAFDPDRGEISFPIDTLVHADCYIGKDGKPSKPFLLPQEDPDKYDYQLYSYNIPELTKGAVEVSPYEIQQVAEKNKPEQVRFK